MSTSGAKSLRLHSNICTFNVYYLPNLYLSKPVHHSDTARVISHGEVIFMPRKNELQS
jgi:hypothetical protein